MKIELSANGLQQGALHQSTLQKLQKQLLQSDAPAGAGNIYGERGIVWNEAEQVMNKDGFAKLAMIKDATLSGITTEFSASAAFYKMYRDATGISEADMDMEISIVTPLNEENIDTYNIYMDILTNRCGYSGGFWNPNESASFFGAEDVTAARQNDPNSLYPRAEEIRKNFADSIDAFVTKLQTDYSTGAIDEEEYRNRQDKINEAYDKYAYKYGNYGMTDSYYMRGVHGLDAFSAWETSLTDIKTRYERGDFGFGEGVYEERLAAWSAAFDKWADREVEYIRADGVMGIVVRDFVKARGSLDETERFFRDDLRKLYANAKAHLLAGNSAQSLTDDILNTGLTFASAGDRRFLFSDVLSEMHVAVFRQSHDINYNNKTQSQYKEEWTDLYERFATRVKSEPTLSETLKNIFLEYVDFASVHLPQVFVSKFIQS